MQLSIAGRIILHSMTPLDICNSRWRINGRGRFVKEGAVTLQDSRRYQFCHILSSLNDSFRYMQQSMENQWERKVCEGRGSHAARLEKNHAHGIQRVFSQSCLSRPFLECEISSIIATHQGHVVGLSNGLENLDWSKIFQVAVDSATRFSMRH
ncbi:uncharacterized protein LOC131038956 isoform X2 [Cryptomeria japonica]|uniref:uncharacterized protein LOC131038956 isoform X2 n=1 Tax=Cryptomeria japonica TaxID=3369 RepID=UPI0027DA4C5F|nr:uncharacterized protein LOC131038956 isoform X2 [Cryptomeria japonica]